MYPFHPMENISLIIFLHLINRQERYYEKPVQVRLLKELSKADIEGLLAMNFHFPETFTATARDGSHYYLWCDLEAYQF